MEVIAHSTIMIQYLYILVLNATTGSFFAERLINGKRDVDKVFAGLLSCKRRNLEDTRAILEKAAEVMDREPTTLAVRA